MATRQPLTATPKSALRRFAVAIGIALALSIVPVFALTAGDVMDSMNEQEQKAYFDGALEMAMYTAAAVERNQAKSQCILNHFYQGSTTAAWRELIGVFNANKDKSAAPLLTVVINRHCGPQAQGNR